MFTHINRWRLFWLAILICFVLGVGQIISMPARERPVGPVINEVMMSNGAGLTDEDGDYSDWIELYNPGLQAVNLAGWALSDDPAQPDKWAFPDRTLASHEYLIVFASGKDRTGAAPEAELHTNFRLKAANEFPILYSIFEEQLHSPGPKENPSLLPALEPPRNVSYGRYGEATDFGLLAKSTPGQPNDTAMVWQGVLPPVTFSTARGFYDNSFSLKLTSPITDAIIRYTMDGSEPTETHGLFYSDPIAISNTALVRAVAVKPGWLPSKRVTHSYIFLDEVLRQPPNPPGFPERWGVHGRDYEDDKAGEAVTPDYEMDPDIVNDPRYQASLPDDLKSIPSLSLVGDRQGFDIYANPRERGEGWERPVSVELIVPDEPDQGFQIEAGIRIQGGEGRFEHVRKHSFRLFFREKYGARKLNYPLFSDSPVDEFDTLVLRGGVSSGYAGISLIDHNLSSYTRDEWLRMSQIATTGLGSHGTFVHLYVNGLYWGLYNVVERPDEAFAASYMGGDKEAWYAINQGGPIRGDSARFDALYELINEGQLDVPARYDLVKQYIDTDHFIDYTLVNWFAGNQDWPDTNWYASVYNPSGQVRFFIWDAEYTWVHGAEIRFGHRDNHFKPLFEALMQNPDFKMAFADKAYQHLFNDGALTDENSRTRWQKINHQINRAIVGETARWGDARVDPPLTREDWLLARDHVLQQMDGNAAQFIALLQEHGYYPKVDPPDFYPRGGLIDSSLRLIMTAPENRGTIYYTVDGSDPRVAVSAEIAPTARIFREPVIMTSTTRVKSRLLVSNPGSDPTWSALNETTFSVLEPDHKLRITEIMYNPLDGNGYEFIELQNTGNVAASLAGLTIDGLGYQFPASALPLPPHEVLVLVNNAEKFSERYPDVVIGGIYSGRLSNSGEQITLRDEEGRVVISVSYDDERGWPISPDGRGDSLVLDDPAGDPNDPRNWRASTLIGGSPGSEKPDSR